MQTEANAIKLRRGGAAIALALAPIGLALLGPGPAGLPAGPAALPSWLTRAPADETVAALAYLVACALTAWAVLVVLLTFAGRLPGMAGRGAAKAALALTPRAARTALHLAVGLSVGVSATVAGAPHALASSARPHPQRSAPVPSLDWPVAAAARPGADRAVVVRPGDTLWGIAARSLGSHPTSARIARAWPRWYAANRRVIGSDPDLIRPGQRLRPPHDTRGGTP